MDYDTVAAALDGFIERQWPGRYNEYDKDIICRSGAVITKAICDSSYDGIVSGFMRVIVKWISERGTIEVDQEQAKHMALVIITEAARLASEGGNRAHS